MSERDELERQTEAAKALDAVLDGLEKRSAAFGAALTGALVDAARGSRDLDDALRSAGLRLTEIALSAGLKPLEMLAGQALTGLFSLLAGGAGGADAGQQGAMRGVMPFVKDGLVAPRSLMNALAPRAGPRAEASREPEDAADAAERRHGGGGEGARIVFNVTARDADSFRKSEGQITAMLTRAVGRGRRGV